MDLLIGIAIGWVLGMYVPVPAVIKDQTDKVWTLIKSKLGK